MGDDKIDAFIAHWRDTGGSELANTQSFINGLCALIGVAPPNGSRTDDAYNDYVFERRVFQDNDDGTTSFGRLDAYKRGAFILEAKQGSDADRAAAARGEDDPDLFGQTATARMKRGTARRGTPGWAKAMVQAKGQAERSLYDGSNGRSCQGSTCTVCMPLPDAIGPVAKKPTLHVEAVADLRLLVHAHILHDVADLLGALERDRQSPVHLGVVPVHLGQTQNLLA